MIETEMKSRLEAKTGRAQLSYILEEEFKFAPKIAAAIVAEAEMSLRVGGEEKGGQKETVVVSRQAGHGRSLRETETVTIKWTIDAGEEDRQVWQDHGGKALRQVRVQRLLLEAVEQGGAASQEDLAQGLNVSVRTIKRDFEELQEQGIYLPSRGNLQGIGRGQTHKGQIIGRWLRGETYDQIALQTHHALVSVQRYIGTFVRVIDLHQQGFSESQISMLLQIGEALVKEYQAVYQSHDQLESRERLQEQLSRLKGQAGGKKGVQ